MNSSFKKIIAHRTEDGRTHSLIEHLDGTAELASEFAGQFGAAAWGRLAGLWHDFGKFSPDFQKRINGADLHVDHSTAGALYAMERFGVFGRVLAYLIAGHHAGLPDWQTTFSGLRGLAQRLTKTKLLEDALKAPVPPEILNQQLPAERPKKGADPALWVRMLFSCVVDSDFLDTENFFNLEMAEKRGGYLDIHGLLSRFNAYMEDKQKKAAQNPINYRRSEILKECTEKAAYEPSIFTLTVPTGGGKTLSSMAFALNHCVKFDKKRIIYVIPYTSIIEQTADVFREVFGENVIEHHSNLDIDEASEETVKARLAAENWDAPIIVTTSVQFFESLFASKTSRCRKLHNIVDSVVVLDEAQLLPPDFLNPIIEVLKELQKTYGVTVVLSTATQPALSPHSSPDFNFPGLPDTVEIMKDPASLQKAFKRVSVKILDKMASEGWGPLSEELKKHPSVLCIVNRRADCRSLYELMPEGTIHLSALMCGAHRSNTIAKIKERLAGGVPTRVISTQLVEAGVDLDFPVVYRAMAGLDSIAQAAGRCNREGKLKEGLLFVFSPPTKAPPGHLRQAAQIGQRLLSDWNGDSFSHTLFEKYFRELFWLKGEALDKHHILEDLRDGELRFSFREAASKFKIIDESQASVLVRYGDGNKWIEHLLKNCPEQWLMRKLQRYSVNIPQRLIPELVRSGDIEEPFEGIFIQTKIGRYDESTGFCYGGAPEPEDLII